jgi:hypothetical protein
MKQATSASRDRSPCQKRPLRTFASKKRLECCLTRTRNATFSLFRSSPCGARGGRQVATRSSLSRSEPSAKATMTSYLQSAKMIATKSLLAHTHGQCKLADRSPDDWSLASSAVHFHEESLQKGSKAYDSVDLALLTECKKLVKQGKSILLISQICLMC